MIQRSLIVNSVELTVPKKLSNTLPMVDEVFGKIPHSDWLAHPLLVSHWLKVTLTNTDTGAELGLVTWSTGLDIFTEYNVSVRVYSHIIT